GLRVSADPGAYLETLQTIIKPPWIDNLADGGKPYVSQEDSAAPYKTLKTQDWMDGREFSSSCHTKILVATSELTSS
ncbi:hypothetical protein ACTXT7_017243, partial [Hymenolepis weldensis]